MDVMAGLALAFFWIHIGLIVAAAGQDLRAVRRLAARLRAGRIERATIVAGTGPEGLLARHRTRQRGRSRGDGRIHFHDRGYDGEVFGGELRTEDGAVLLVPEAAPDLEVWPTRAARQLASEVPEADRATAYREACRGPGWLRAVDVAFPGGAVVWVARARDAGQPWLIAQEDPRRWIRDRTLRIGGLVAIELAASAACTVAALWPPLYGPISTAGALVALVWFQLAQDGGRIVAELARPPSRAPLRGRVRAG